MSKLGDVIYTLRSNASLTMEDLAAKADLTSSTIYKIETGATEPSSRTIKKVAKALGIKASDIWKMVEKEETKKVV